MSAVSVPSRIRTNDRCKSLSKAVSLLLLPAQLWSPSEAANPDSRRERGKGGSLSNCLHHIQSVSYSSR